ncbi:ribonuclease H-like domain-containing protein, partial [Tanacetum coccineum]
MHSPLQTHFEAALRVLRYLKSALGAGVVYTKSSIRTVSAYANSDWAKCKMTRRSVSGYCVFVFGGLVSCKSKKQATLLRSSAEAEYRSMACATCEVIWIVKILKDLNFEKVIPVSLFCDNNLVMHEKTKHFDIDVHLIREKVASGLIKTVKVDSESQIADILTKGLSNFQHNELCSKSSYARALIEVRVDVELKDDIVVPMPKLVGEGFYTCTDECPKNIDSDVVKNIKKPGQATRGVSVGPKVGFKPFKQVYM